ncbi:MAG: zinc-ribbon domain-containing protein [Blautia sp.]
MLCKKCGTENPDGAKYCSKCGKALNEKSTAKKNREKGIVLALCVIVAVVLLVYTLGGRSYKKTIDTFVTSQFAVDAQSIVELLPEKVLDKELEETGYSKTELVEETNDSLKKQVDYIDQYLGDDWKLSYKMTNVEDVTGDDLNDLKSNYEDINVKVSTAKTVEVEFTLKGDETEISNSLEVSVIKVDRSWYLDLYTMGNLF